MTHTAQAAYYRHRASVWHGEEERALAGRLAAMHEALACRDEVRGLRTVVRIEGGWKACQVGWLDDLEAARERWREAIDAMNWTGFYAHHGRAA